MPIRPIDSNNNKLGSGTSAVVTEVEDQLNTPVPVVSPEKDQVATVSSKPAALRVPSPFNTKNVLGFL